MWGAAESVGEEVPSHKVKTLILFQLIGAPPRRFPGSRGSGKEGSFEGNGVTRSSDRRGDPPT